MYKVLFIGIFLFTVFTVIMSIKIKNNLEEALNKEIKEYSIVVLEKVE